MDRGLGSAIYLSIFGGNEDDSGSEADEPFEFWGNKLETDRDRKLRSQTQALLHSVPCTSAHLRRVEDAVKADLVWIVSRGIASAVEAEVTIPNFKRLAINGAVILANGARLQFPELEANWPGPA